jgi:hypothetical protein
MEIAVKSCKGFEILLVCQRIWQKKNKEDAEGTCSPPSFQTKPVSPVIPSLVGSGILLFQEFSYGRPRKIPLNVLSEVFSVS